MKYESRKNEKILYVVKTKPSVIEVPEQNFITISGEGDPNMPEFSERVGALYSIAFPIKMNYKFFFKNNPDLRPPDGYDDFMVFPLEGVWSSYSTDPTDKSQFIYTIMIKQPYFVTSDMFDDALKSAKEKKDNLLLNEVQFQTLEEGLCVQMLHKGPFDDEPASFDEMSKFCDTEGLKRVGYEHKEIYLSDFRRTKPENLKTILRYKVER